MSGPGDQAFVLRVDGDKAELLRRGASAVLAITPGAVRNVLIMALEGFAMLAFGGAIIAAAPVPALCFIALGLFLVARSNFMNACVAQPGATDAKCECTLDEITQAVPVEEFVAYDEALQQDPATPPPSWLEAAVMACD